MFYIATRCLEISQTTGVVKVHTPGLDSINPLLLSQIQLPLVIIIFVSLQLQLTPLEIKFLEESHTHTLFKLINPFVVSHTTVI